MADKIVNITEAREQKKHERKEEKLDDIKQRFSKAMGMEDKPKKRFGWGKKKKAKPKPEGW